MGVEVRVPDLGEAEATEATVSFWYYDPGETVKEGEDLVELLTDKATFNVTVPVSGRLVETPAGEGAVVKPGDVLARIEAEG